MNATGNFKAGAITPAKLLGKREPRERKAATATEVPIDEMFKLLGGEVGDGTKS